MQYSALFALPLVPAAFAYGSGYSSPDKATSDKAEAAVAGVHVVKVGDGGLTFEPAELKAAIGEVVEFHFYPQAHSVAQSSFDAPCQPLNTTGFFSGPVPVASGVGEQVFSVTIEDEKPLWYYCATGQHCQNGMVGVINAPANGQRTLSQYAEAASAAEDNVAPEEVGGGVLGAPATTPPSSAPTPSETPQSAGVSIRGDIRWGLMTFGVAMTGFIGGMMM
ncbi:putative GPI-anchored cupredoxin [Paramyrothecium foliicola]|nr:putative GPI-anchored cupredoxin [Paramyrothecium foliicola]